MTCAALCYYFYFYNYTVIIIITIITNIIINIITISILVANKVIGTCPANGSRIKDSISMCNLEGPSFGKLPMHRSYEVDSFMLQFSPPLSRAVTITSQNASVL